MRVITQHGGSIVQEPGLVNNLGSKEDAKETFLAVKMVQSSDEIIYSELKQYMHNRYINNDYRWPKTLLAAPNVLVNWKGGKRTPTENYESNEGVDLTTKGNGGRFRGDCYNCEKFRYMA